VFSPRKTLFELATSLKNNETEETNRNRSVDDYQLRNSINKSIRTKYCHRIAGDSIRNFGSQGPFLLGQAIIHDFPGKLRPPFSSSAWQKTLPVQLQIRFSKTCMVLQLAGRSSQVVP
jgi:hypothetical protein